MRSIPGGIDGLEAVFDDSCLVADGGLLLVGTVMHRLGLEALIDETVRLDGRVAGSGSGRKVLSLVASMLVGGCCIDDVQRLRSGSAAAVLPFAPLAPSTLGCGVVFEVVHVRACAPARQSGRAGACAGVVCGRGAEPADATTADTASHSAPATDISTTNLTTRSFRSGLLLDGLDIRISTIRPNLDLNNESWPGTGFGVLAPA